MQYLYKDKFLGAVGTICSNFYKLLNNLMQLGVIIKK